jgi:hypothetical protein
MSRPWKAMRPCCGPVEAAQHVQQRALARAVGADQRQHLVVADLDADLGQCGDATEAQRDALGAENGRGAGRATLVVDVAMVGVRS